MGIIFLKISNGILRVVKIFIYISVKVYSGRYNVSLYKCEAWC